MHLAFEAGQLIACGGIGFVVITLWRRFGPRSKYFTFASIALVATAVGVATLPEDLHIRAGKISVLLGIPFQASHGALVLAAANTVTAAAILGRLCARRCALLGMATGLAAVLGNHWILRYDYPAIHLFVGWSAATLIAASLAKPDTQPSISPWKTPLITVATLLLLAASWLTTPSYAVAEQLFRLPGGFVAPLSARVRPGPATSFVVPTEAWFVDRSNHPDIAPSEPPLLPSNGIVMLLVVDAMRADVLSDPRHESTLPHITALRKSGVHFTNARTVAPATAQAVSAMFSGRYYSQLYWRTKPGDHAEVVYPHEDPSPRFPHLLAQGGVDTVTFAGLPGLVNGYGIASGFTEETVVPGPRFPGAELRASPQMPKA
jgi:hypothetical protein